MVLGKVNIEDISYPTAGWYNRTYAANVQMVKTEIEMTDELRRTMGQAELEVIVKSELVRKLSKELMDNNLINIIQEYAPTADPFDRKMKFRAELAVAEPKISNVLIDNYVYEVDGVVFSHEDIAKAIKNTFPEHYL